MDFKTLLVQSEGSVWTLTLNRPERRNAMSLEMVKELRAALAQAEVILFAPALVTLAFDGEFHPLMLLQVARIAGKGGFRVGTDGSFVIVKESVFDVLVELLILADFLDRRCRWRRWRWDRHGHAGGGTLRAAWTRGGQGVGGRVLLRDG